MNKELKRKRIAFELFFIFFAALCLFGAGFFDFSDCSVFSFLLVDDPKIFTTLFTVQATTTALSIAVLTLLTGSMKDSHAGISVTRYIAWLRPVFLKHRFVIVCNVLMTLINYFLVSLKLYNLSVAVFTTCILITVYLIIDIYSVFRGIDSINQEIEDYYLSNYNKLGLKDIETAVFLTPDTVNAKDYLQNIFLLKGIYINKIKNGESDYSSLDSLLARIYKSLLVSNDEAKIESFISMMCDIYQEANAKQEKICLRLWDGLSWDYYRSLRIIDLFKRENFQNVQLLYFCLYGNQVIKESQIDNQEKKYEPINCQDLSSYATQVYYGVYTKKSHIENNNTNYKEYLCIIRSIIEEIGYRLEDKKLIDYQKNNILKELSLLYRYLIYNGEFDAIQKYVFHYEHYHNKRKRLAVLIALIYIYYLKTEPITPEEILRNTDEIINQNRANIHHVLLYSDISSQEIIKFYSFIQDTMRLWEEWPEDGGGKLIVMDGAIRQFLVFFALSNSWSEQEINNLFAELFQANMYYAYTTYSYRENPKIENEYKNYLHIFQFYTNDEDADSADKQSKRQNELQQMESSLALLYKEDEIQHREEYRITDKTEEKYTQKVLQHIAEFTKENSFLFECDAGKEYANQENIIILRTNILSISPDSAYFDDQIKRYISSSIIISVIKRIRDHISIEKIDESSNTKQQTLIDLICEKNINPDMMIGSRDMFWNEENRSLLTETFDNLHKISYNGGYYNIYLIDSKRLRVHISDINVEYSVLDDNEIMDRQKTDENGNALYRTLSGVYLPFTKEEYKEYMNSSYKSVYISAKISWEVEDGIIGAGIEINKK